MSVRKKVKQLEAYSFVVMLEIKAKQCVCHNCMVKFGGRGCLDDNHEDKRGSVTNARDGMYVKYRVNQNDCRGTIVQRQFRTKFGKQPPSDNNIRRWYAQFQDTG